MIVNYVPAVVGEGGNMYGVVGFFSHDMPIGVEVNTPVRVIPAKHFTAQWVEYLDQEGSVFARQIFGEKHEVWENFSFTGSALVPV